MWFDNTFGDFDKQNNILYYEIPDELICNKKSVSEKLIHESQKIISEHQANAKHDQIEDIKADQALRTKGIGEFGDVHNVHPVVATNEQGEEIRIMNNETEVPDDDAHKQRFLKDNPGWKHKEDPLTDEQKKMLEEMEKGGKGKFEIKSSGGVETIKDGKPTGNKLPKKKKEKKE